MKNNTQLLALLGIVIVIVIGLLGYLTLNRLKSAQTTNSSASEFTMQESQNSENKVEADITIGNGAVSPIQVNAAHLDTVVLNVTSEDSTNSHRFYLPEFNLDETVLPGESKTITFTAGGVGTFIMSNCGEACLLSLDVRAKMDDEQ